MLGKWLKGIWWWLLTTTMRVTTSIRLICIKSGIIPIRNRMLLPRRVINSLRLLPSLIVPSLMHVVIVVPISYNII
ncbi:hypothetical protein AHAS_Ahas19G0132800 [Arachis hypogaea]